MRSMTSRSRQRGFSLVEVMVATAILVVILVAILMLYDRANKVFKSGNEAADMQQSVRIAYDRMIGDIRMAGFDYKRGGTLLPGQNAAPWAPTRAYSAGTIVTPTVANGHTYRAVSAGTSGPTQPAWPTGTGATVLEGGATPPITWQENGGAVYEQPDEQVEYAGATALTIRGNFDYSANEAGDTDHGREPALESAQFPMVTTDNAEIVTYALVSDQAPAGTAPNNQSITMFIDMNNGGTPSRTAYPGGNAERDVEIDDVDLTNANPPYTLYRFNFANDGSVQRTPLASNIRSLNFFYYSDTQATQPLRDAAGALVPNIGGAGQFDPAVAGSMNSPDRLVRRTIRSIRVRLVGMASQPDSAFADTSTANGQLGSTSTAGVPTFVTDTGNAKVGTVPVAMTRYRRLTVDTVVVPRNLGLAGMAQTFLQPPPRPTLTDVCVGYCGIATISWNPNTNNPNASYVVMWDRSCTGSFSHSYDAGTSNTFAIDLTAEDLSLPFCFEVRAFNAGGSVFSTNTMSGTAQNATVPNIPTGFSASGGGVVPPIAGKVHLSWTAPVTNASGNPTCTSGTPPVTNYLREIRGFRIYKSTSSGTNASSATLVRDETATDVVTDGYGNFSWDDTNVVCGQDYYYRIKTVEWCAAQGNYNTSGVVTDAISVETPINSSSGLLGKSGTSGTPQAPVNFQIAPDAPNTPPLGLTASSCDAVSNLCTVNMGWSRVTQDTSSNPVSIDTYELTRVQYEINGLGVAVPTGLSNTLTLNNALAQPGSTVTFSDAPPASGAPYLDTLTGARYSYKYQVRALQANPPTGACPASAFSAWADYPPPCTFTGSVVVQTGASSGDGLTPATSWVMNTGDTIQVNPPGGTTFVNTTMEIKDPSGTTLMTNTSAASPANFTWANLTPGTPYTITFTMTNNAVPPCTEQLIRYIQQEPLPACSLTTFATQSSILASNATPNVLQLDLINAATEALTMQSIDFTWTAPSRVTWNSIKFPSAAGATVAGPGTTSGSFTIALSPKPAQLTTNDITVPASGTRSLILNFAKTSGNPTLPPATSAISFICVKYTRASVTQPSGSVTSITVTAGGSGYTSAPTVTINDASGIGATATATITSGVVTAITVTGGGAGYVNPTVVISGGGGTGATASASTQVPIPFACAIKPDSNASNPTTCQ